jgi:hypothetical protein
MDEDDLKKRTKRFGLRIIKLVCALPKTQSVVSWCVLPSCMPVAI